MAHAKLSGALLVYKELPSATLTRPQSSPADENLLSADRIASAEPVSRAADNAVAPEPARDRAGSLAADSGWRVAHLVRHGLAGFGFGIAATTAAAMLLFGQSSGKTTPPMTLAAVPPALSMPAEPAAPPQAMNPMPAAAMPEPTSAPEPTATSASDSPASEASAAAAPASSGAAVLPQASQQPAPAASAPAAASLAVAASAGPGTGIRLPTEETEALLGRGDQLLARSDIATARLFYQRAAEGGEAQAALRLAATYDPAFLAQAGLTAVRGDRAAAARWYRQARALGAVEAEPLLTSLGDKPAGEK